MAGRRAARKHDDIFLVAPYRYATSHPRERLLKRIGLVFGLISGVMVSAMLVFSMALGVQMGVGGMIIGYTTMLIASLLVYFGIRAYRDNVGSGSVVFGRALQIGLSISLISTVCYVVSWEIVYRTMMPDFAEKYSAATVKSEREMRSAPERIVTLDPTMRSEIRKTRPYVVVSPDEMNQHIRTVLVAPLTSKGTPYPTRVASRFGGRVGQVLLDQLQAVDVQRLTKRSGTLSPSTQTAVLATLGEMRAP